MAPLVTQVSFPLVPCCDLHVSPMAPLAQIAPSKPVFKQQPRTVFANLNERVNFTCVASGSPQPRIQWYKDGSPLANQSSHVLVIEEADVSDRGIFYCTASNAEGVATSTLAVLNIAGIQQYVVPVLIPIPGSSRFQNFENGNNPSPELVAALSRFVMDLNEQGTGSKVDGPGTVIYIYSIGGNTKPVTVFPTK